MSLKKAKLKDYRIGRKYPPPEFFDFFHIHWCLKEKHLKKLETLLLFVILDSSLLSARVFIYNFFYISFCSFQQLNYFKKVSKTKWFLNSFTAEIRYIHAKFNYPLLRKAVLHTNLAFVVECQVWNYFLLRYIKFIAAT